jgi:hypothetical protein
VETNLFKAVTTRIENGFIGVFYDLKTNKYLGEVNIYAKFPEDFDAYSAFRAILKDAETIETLYDTLSEFTELWFGVIQTRKNFSKR